MSQYPLISPTHDRINSYSIANAFNLQREITMIIIISVKDNQVRSVGIDNKLLRKCKDELHHFSINKIIWTVN